MTWAVICVVFNVQNIGIHPSAICPSNMLQSTDSNVTYILPARWSSKRSYIRCRLLSWLITCGIGVSYVDHVCTDIPQIITVLLYYFIEDVSWFSIWLWYYLVWLLFSSSMITSGLNWFKLRKKTKNRKAFLIVYWIYSSSWFTVTNSAENLAISGVRLK